MITIMTRLEGQEKASFTWGWLYNTNYFLSPLSDLTARASDPQQHGTSFIGRSPLVQVDGDHLCQDNSDGRLGSSPRVMFLMHLQETPRFSLSFWLLVARPWSLAVQAARGGQWPLGGHLTLKLCAPHKNFTPRVPRVLGGFPASMTWRGKYLQRKIKLVRWSSQPSVCLWSDF